jgi:hypothetical protein
MAMDKKRFMAARRKKIFVVYVLVFLVLAQCAMLLPTNAEVQTLDGGILAPVHLYSNDPNMIAINFPVSGESYVNLTYLSFTTYQTGLDYGVVGVGIDNGTVNRVAGRVESPTVFYNVSLPSLSPGFHSIAVYLGNTNLQPNGGEYWAVACDIVDFVISPITISMPLNTTYRTSAIPFSFSIDQSVSWMAYSLDNQNNVTINGNFTLDGLADGNHSLVVYANDSYGNMGASNTTYFTIDTTSPNISNLSIEDKTYNTAEIPLTFNTNETTSWEGYSLDDKAYQTVNGNFTLNGLSDGTHSIVICANDTFGNMGKSSIAYFTVDTIPPSISNLSLENKTYSSKSIPLNFDVNETASWIGYSLDNQANQTVNGNFTLNGLSEGEHSIIVYCNDSAGNMARTDTVFFTINTQLSLPLILGIVAIVIVAVAVGTLVYFRKRTNHK